MPSSPRNEGCRRHQAKEKAQSLLFFLSGRHFNLPFTSLLTTKYLSLSYFEQQARFARNSAQYEHRNRGMREYMLGFAAQQQALDATVAVRSHDDQVTVFFFSGLEQ